MLSRERFIAAKVFDVSRDYWLGDQTALEALVRFGDEEIKHLVEHTIYIPPAPSYSYPSSK